MITSAGIILAGTFSVLMTLPVTFAFNIGFMVAVGILLDTFVVRTIMLPAAVELIGDRIWWPSDPSGGAARRCVGEEASGVRSRARAVVEARSCEKSRHLKGLGWATRVGPCSRGLNRYERRHAAGLLFRRRPPTTPPTVPHRVLGDHLRIDELQQVVGAAGLEPGAGQAVAAERLAADHRAGDLAVDVEVADRACARRRTRPSAGSSSRARR